MGTIQKIVVVANFWPTIFKYMYLFIFLFSFILIFFFKTYQDYVFFQELSADEVNYRHDFLRHAICVPETCPHFNRKGDLSKEINRCYDEKFRERHLKGVIRELSCETDKSPHPIDWFDIFAGFVYFFLV